MLKGIFFHAQIFLAGICAYAALYHCTVDTGRSQRRVHLLFAGISILMALYIITNIQCFMQPTLDDFIPVLRLTFVFYGLFVGLFPWFIASYSGVRPMPMLAGLSVLVAALFVVNLIEPYTILYSEIREFKHVILPGGEDFFTARGPGGIWFFIWVFTVYIVYLFGIYTLVGCFRPDRRRTTLIMIFAVGMLLAFSIAGTLFRMGIIHIPPLVPFGFLGMVIVMGLTLNYEMQQDRRRLEEESHRYSHLLNKTGDMARIGGWELALDTMKLFWSDQVYRIHELNPDFSVSVEDAVGFYTPEARPVILEAVRSTMESGTPFELELQIRTALNHPLWVRAQGEPEYHNGKIVKLFGTFQDINEYKLAEVEREVLINQLQDKTTELERFIYTVSHDLKSPLITISGFLGFLKEDFSRHDEVGFVSTISRIALAAERMKQLLDELLELSRIGRKTNPPERVGLSDLVQKAVEQVSGHIHEFGAIVEVEPDLPEVMVDRSRILQVYENLIDNAVKFSSGREEPPRITVGVRRNAEGEQVLFVADNGIGIETRYSHKVFELFEKLDPRSSGTGVGLAIVKRIIELHGGKIWAESSGTGCGTTFCFTLPMVKSY